MIVHFNCRTCLHLHYLHCLHYGHYLQSTFSSLSPIFPFIVIFKLGISNMNKLVNLPQRVSCLFYVVVGGKVASYMSPSVYSGLRANVYWASVPAITYIQCFSSLGYIHANEVFVSTGVPWGSVWGQMTIARALHLIILGFHNFLYKN